ncbi:uncharacterized protein TNCV_1608491 [Trichonephila clavipes]|nr:uncharacterized protein TNCV_1608491 [Trichonephila clavipes]
MNAAVHVPVIANDNNSNIAVAVDGTWHKRGYSSLNGVVCATSVENGNVIDFEALTKYFSLCKGKKKPCENCARNYEGFSGGMKCRGVLSIFNRSIVTGEFYIHKHSLPKSILLKVKKVFRDLTEKDLLKKCLHGRTQNPNESFNKCIWERIPKTVFVGIETLKIGVMDDVICFNDGYVITQSFCFLISLSPPGVPAVWILCHVLDSDDLMVSSSAPVPAPAPHDCGFKLAACILASS